MTKEIKPSDTLRYILIAMVCTSAVILMIGLFVSEKPVGFALGLLFGTVVSIIRILMLTKAVCISVDMEAAEAKTYMLGQYNLRMLLTIAAVVVGAMLRDKISIFGIMAGLVAMSPSVYIANFVYERLGGKKLESVSTKKADRYS